MLEKIVRFSVPSQYMRPTRKTIVHPDQRTSTGLRKTALARVNP